MKLPERIEIKVFADGRPAAGMFVCVTLRTTRKNDFGLGFGPTSEGGGLHISREDLLREAEKEQRLFIMDYGHPEDDFSGEIVVKPLNREALESAIAAYHTYHQVTPYPPRYAEQVQEARTALDESRPLELSAEVKHTNEGVRIRVETCRA